MILEYSSHITLPAYIGVMNKRGTGINALLRIDKLSPPPDDVAALFSVVVNALELTAWSGKDAVHVLARSRGLNDNL